jgi:ElaB/YqjD/DUF883 family membrane-anchored ribosome-binding protein
MNDNTDKTLQLIDQFSNTAHQIVDQLQESAVSMESIIGKRSMETSERIKAGISREANTLEKYVEENPEISAVIAFAFGVAATRFLKSAQPAGTAAGAAKPAAKMTKAA